MVLWLPQKGRVRMQQSTGAVGTATIGTSVTTGGTASTKGTAVQLIASTNFDAYMIWIIADNYAAATTASRGCLDILIGSATEDILIPNLLFGNAGGIASTAKKGPKCWWFPLYIPSGSRIAAQAAGDRVSTAFGVSVYLFGGWGMPPFRVGANVTTYGIGTVPAGTAITPGASGAEGSFTQITASTTDNHFAFVPSFQEGGTTINLRNYSMDMGVGAATEDMCFEGWWFAADTNESIQGPFPPMPCISEVPSGTRIALRVSNSGTNDAGGYECALHAVS